MTPRIAAIIPARLGSTRFPNKPLLSIQGLPMVEHVRRRTALCRSFSEVVVATCDTEIQKVIESYGGRVIMTSPRHPGATDRVAEALQALDCTHVVNVQGDEILVRPEDLEILTAAIRAHSEGPAWNALGPIEKREQLSDHSIVKCVVSRTDKVLFCSRDFSQWPLKPPFEPVRIILGLLAYERHFLTNFSRLARTPAETAESIDQNRILEHDFPLRGVSFPRAYPGINEPREVDLVDHILHSDSRQKALLSAILQ
jgi:3-deoxy-manno-octulosonate cytidylyltransferase (CMP-KDO synthetase)